MVSEIFRSLKFGWAWACLVISNFKPSCKTIYQYLSYPKKSEQSLQWIVRNSLVKILVVLGTPVGQPWRHDCWLALESDILNYETLLHNFTSISTISPYFKTIRPEVTNNLLRTTFGRKEKEVEEEGKEKE